MIKKSGKVIIADMLALIVGLSAFGCAKGGLDKPSENGKEPPVTIDKEYTVTFVQDGYEDVVRKWRDGEIDTPAPIPEKGYSVVWNVTDFSSIERDTTVYAIKTANEYSVTLDPNGGKFDSEETVPVIRTVTYAAEYALPVVTKENHSFISWKDADGKTIADKGAWGIDGDVTLTASYAENEKYGVTFVQVGCADVYIEVYKGDTLTTIPEPQPKEHYDAKWEYDDLSTRIIDGALVVRAVETPKTYTATFNYGDKTEVKSVKYGDKFTFPVTEKVGYSVKWRAEQTPSFVINGGSEIRYEYSDTAFVAEYVPNKYTVTFVTADGTKAETVVYKEKLKLPVIDEDCFDHWEIEGESSYLTGTEITYDYARDLKLVAVYDCKVTIVLPEGVKIKGFKTEFRVKTGSVLNDYLKFYVDVDDDNNISSYAYIGSDGKKNIYKSVKFVCPMVRELTLYAQISSSWTPNY